MTNIERTKRSLLMSGLALLLCISMLIGSTFAWFTDSVVSENNIIKSGSLSVALNYADGTKEVPAKDSASWIDASTGPIYKYTLWEPGYTDVRHIQIKNTGTLAMQYQLTIEVDEGEISPEELYMLADVIDVYFYDPAQQIAGRTDLDDAKKVGTLHEMLTAMPKNTMGKLLAGESAEITIALKMQESAGNEYQGKSLGASFSICLLATQLTYEKDSFDDQYEADANRDSNITVMTEAELQAAFDGAKDGDVITVANDIEIVNGLTYNTAAAVTLNLDGHSLYGSLEGKPLLKANPGNMLMQNGYIKNVMDPCTVTLVSVFMTGDATAKIENVTIETTGIGLHLQGDAKVTELNANINSYANANGYCDASAICLDDGNARIDLISGGEYISTYADKFIDAYSGSFSGAMIYPIKLNNTNVSVGEISGGTFLGRTDDGRNGAVLYVNAGKIEKISGGYFGYCEKTMRNSPYGMITVNAANGASIDAITGGTFEYAGYFGCEFENVVAQSGATISVRAEKKTVSYKLSSSVKTKDVAIWDVVS